MCRLSMRCMRHWNCNPKSVREQINYGLALLRTGKNDAAVEQLTQAQKQDPSLPYTWFNLGIFYKHAGDYDKAMEQLRGMIRAGSGRADRALQSGGGAAGKG